MGVGHENPRIQGSVQNSKLSKIYRDLDISKENSIE